MADFVYPQVVAFIDWEDNGNASLISDIESDVNEALGEVNVVYRKPGTDIVENTTFVKADVDPLDLTVYTWTADDDVNDQLTLLNNSQHLDGAITVNTIDQFD